MIDAVPKTYIKKIIIEYGRKVICFNKNLKVETPALQQ